MKILCAAWTISDWFCFDESHLLTRAHIMMSVFLVQWRPLQKTIFVWQKQTGLYDLSCGCDFLSLLCQKCQKAAKNEGNGHKTEFQHIVRVMKWCRYLRTNSGCLEVSVCISSCLKPFTDHVNSIISLAVHKMECSFNYKWMMNILWLYAVG